MVAGAGWLGVTWVAYPLCLAARAKVRPVGLREDSEPVRSVALVCVARNERARIAERLAELAALERGDVELSCVVVDDGSDDGTADAVRAALQDAGERVADDGGWATRGWVGRAREDATGFGRERAGERRGLAVTLLERGPEGKALGLLAGIAEARRCEPEVIVFCDVRQRIPPSALVELLAPLSDGSVGVSSGVVRKATRTMGGLYWRYESWVRRLESRTGSTVGATGPWYAVRTPLLPTSAQSSRVGRVQGLLLDDVWLPMEAAFEGARVVVAEGAVIEDVEHRGGVERMKKARTLTGNLQLVRRWPDLLMPGKNPLWSRFSIHKMMRLGTPLALGAMAAAPLVGAIVPGPLQAAWIAAAGMELVGLAVVMSTRQGRELMALVGASAQAWTRFLSGDERW